MVFHNFKIMFGGLVRQSSDFKDCRFLSCFSPKAAKSVQQHGEVIAFRLRCDHGVAHRRFLKICVRRFETICSVAVLVKILNEPLLIFREDHLGRKVNNNLWPKMHSKKNVTLSSSYRTTAKNKINRCFLFLEVNNGSLASRATVTWPMFAVCFDIDLAKIFKLRRFGGPTEKQTTALYNNASCLVFHLLKTGGICK